MKNYLIALFFTFNSANVFAELTIKTNDSIQDQIDFIEVEDQKNIEIPDDLVSKTKNYLSFKVGLYSFYTLYNQALAKKDFDMVCTYQEIMSEYLINNIVYAEQYNKEKNKPDAYQRLLHAVSSDSLANKKGCDGEAYFIK